MTTNRYLVCLTAAEATVTEIGAYPCAVYTAGDAERAIRSRDLEPRGAMRTPNGCTWASALYVVVDAASELQAVMIAATMRACVLTPGEAK